MEGRSFLSFGATINTYGFDGNGDVTPIDLDSFSLKPSRFKFKWIHVYLPRNHYKLSVLAKYLSNFLSPFIMLESIIYLLSDGPFCGEVNNGFIFRLNSPGPRTSRYTVCFAAYVKSDVVITVSLVTLKQVPRLFVFGGSIQSLVQEKLNSVYDGDDGDEELEYLLKNDRSDKHVPRNLYGLLVHFIESHMDDVQDLLIELEIPLESAELQFYEGCAALKKEVIYHKIIPEMHLRLQHLLQFVAHGEQLLPRVKEICAAYGWLRDERMPAMEELIGRLARLKVNMRFIVNRVTIIQHGLHSWQAEKLNKKLNYFSSVSMIFLLLSIVIGVFSKNVEGISWTGQNNLELKHGFRNVLLLFAVMVSFLFFWFTYFTICQRIAAWRKQAD